MFQKCRDTGPVGTKLRDGRTLIILTEEAEERGVRKNHITPPAPSPLLLSGPQGQVTSKVRVLELE